MKYTSISSRSARKVGRGCKRSLEVEDSDPSEGSCDSGLGLDHQAEVQLATRGTGKRSLPYAFEEETNSEFCFPTMPGRGRGNGNNPNCPLSAVLSSTSRDGRVSLAIVSQPEQQHRARYQTEGSRGAVKDRTGNGFPMVKLSGHNKPAILQIFVGTDVGRVAPHMFYQACRVSGKNSTPCIERKVDGTVVIEVDLDPSKDMVVTCDCVGILKERNVDVEHRFPEQTASRNKKKSTRCRMIFRTVIQNDEGSSEILQVCSQPIVCTQPPGVPEICKKSLSSCPSTGGLELFVLGKNFLKDTKVVFSNSDVHPRWEETVLPDKEFLQQNHLVCVVPPYRCVDIAEPVPVKMYITSGGKSSDPHSLMFVPFSSHMAPTPMDVQPCSSYLSGLASSAFVNGNRVLAKGCNLAGVLPSVAYNSSDSNNLDTGKRENSFPPLVWATATKPEACEDDETMMPPPPALIPLVRRPSLQQGITDKEEFKTEVMDELSQHSMSCDRDSSLSPTDSQGVDLSMKPPSFRHLVELPLCNPFLKTEPTKQFPVLFENEPQQFLEDALLRPPPSKIIARDYVDGNSYSNASDVTMADAGPSGFGFMPRVRSGSFSHGTTINDTSLNGFDTFSRVRSASMSHTYGTKASAFSQPSHTLHSKNCTQKDIDCAISSMVKPTMHNLQPGFFSMGTATQGDVLAQASSDSVMSSPPLSATTLSSARALDAIVNSAADSHINPSPVTVSPPTSFAAPSLPVSAAYEVPTNTQSASIPVMVREMALEAQRIGEMEVPPGPAPPITGMVPQEMVKMTDNDLISYINPSCFDQGFPGKKFI